MAIPSLASPLAVPGQCLGPISSYSAGSGTHISNAHVYASIAGPVIANPVQSNAMLKPILTVSRTYNTTTTTGTTGTTGNFNSNIPLSTAKPKLLKYNTLPSVDSIVLARVTRVQKRQATVAILVVLDDSASASSSSQGQGQGQAPGKKPLLTTASDNDNMEAILSTAANPENHSSTDELRFQALIRKEDVRAVEKDRVIMDDMFRVGDIVRGTVISLGDQSFYYITTARNDFGVVMAMSENGNMMFPVSWKEMRDPVTGIGEARKVARPF